MKLTLQTLLFILLFSFSDLYSANKSYSDKLGKVTDYELQMDVFEDDPSAVAVVLYKKCFIHYVFNSKNQPVLEYVFEGKIKILKDAGLDFGNIYIRYTDDEKILINSMTTYNVENGKVVKDKYDKKYLFEEDEDKKYKLKKIAMPGVKVGSVIEYKYTHISEDEIPDKWYAQAQIPVVSATYEIMYPEYFKYKHDVKSRYHYESKKDIQTVSMRGPSGLLLEDTGEWCTFTFRNLPALKDDEPYIWASNDYRANVSSELTMFNIPGYVYKDFSSSWNSVEKSLLDFSDFRKAINYKHPFQAEMSALNIDSLPFEEKIYSIFSLLKSNINWNGKYEILPSAMNNVIKNRAGSNAEMNLILMSMLRSAGIASVPAITRLRSSGRMPLIFPGIKGLSTFVLALKNEDKYYFIDASQERGCLNVLPYKLLSEKVMLLNIAETVKDDDMQFPILDMVRNKWHNLSNSGNSATRLQLNCEIFPEEGIIRGEGIINTRGLDMYDNISIYSRSDNENTYVDNYASVLGVSVSDYLRKDAGYNLTENFSFEKEINMVANDEYYVNPLIIPHLNKNIFEQQERELPVEFSKAELHNVVVNIKIPDGYEIIEMPKSKALSINEDGARCTYKAVPGEGKLTVIYTYRLNKTFFGTDDYGMLRTFYASIADMNKDMIILKKKN